MSLQGTIPAGPFPHTSHLESAASDAAIALQQPGFDDRAPRMPDFHRKVYCLLGLPLDAIDSDGAVSVIRRAIETRVPLFLSTPNLDFLTTSQRDPAFRRSIVRSDLSVCDGMPLVWIARLIGSPIRQRVTGSDLFELVRRGDSGPVKVFFFGGPKGVAQEARDKINAGSPSMTCVGGLSPGYGSIVELSNARTLSTINASDPDFVVVALGGQKGQAWIEHNRLRITAPVISHLGAVINFAAERLSRAPKVVQRSGFEWLWRIKEEPALWRRYRDNGIVLVKLLAFHVVPLMIASRMARGRKVVPAGWHVHETAQGECLVKLTGRWHEADLPPLRAALEAAVRGRDIALDLSRFDGCDSAFLGLLMLVYGYQSNERRGFRTTGARTAVRTQFRLHCALYLLDDPLRPGIAGNR